MARVALLVDELSVSKYVKDLVDWIEAEEGIELAGVVVHRAPQSQVRGWRKIGFLARQQGVNLLMSRIVFAAIVRIERRLVLRSSLYRSYLQRFDIGELSSNQIHTNPGVSKSGFVYRFSDDDIRAISALRADVLVRCGNGILKGAILSAARHGVISMHHADNRVNRGGPAGFWEVYKREPRTGFIVQRLTEELDGGEVLFRGYISTDPLFSRNQVNLYARSNACLMRTLRRVCNGAVTPEAPHVYDDRLYRTPGMFVTLAYVAKTLLFFARKAVRRIAGFKWRWGVGYLRGDWRGAVLWRARVLKNPPGHFLADPFAVDWNGRSFLFVEDFIYAKDKGVISVYEVGPDGASDRIGVALEEDCHLSFPFLFRYQGVLYMIPETSSVEQVRLYRCDDFPTKWTLDRVLLDGVNAVDSIVFEELGRWWMLTTINETGLGANDAELYLLSADSPLGPWQRNSEGPLFVDSGRGRNGGLLRSDDGLFRVAQRHGFGDYGRGASIYKIGLGPKGYSEQKVQDVSPNFRTGLKGVHHLHCSDSLLAFDFRRNSRVRRAGA